MGLPDRIDPFDVPCRGCQAGAGEQCRNEVTGKPLKRALAHPVRIRDAYPDIDDIDDVELERRYGVDA